jgi:hypothetical protein
MQNHHFSCTVCSGRWDSYCSSVHAGCTALSEEENVSWNPTGWECCSSGCFWPLEVQIPLRCVPNFQVWCRTSLWKRSNLEHSQRPLFSGRMFLKGPNGPATRPWKLQAKLHAWPWPEPPCLFPIPWNWPRQEKIPWHGHCSRRLPCNNLPCGKLLAILIKDSTHDAHGKACGLSKLLGQHGLGPAPCCLRSGSSGQGPGPLGMLLE